MASLEQNIKTQDTKPTYTAEEAIDPEKEKLLKIIDITEGV